MKLYYGAIFLVFGESVILGEDYYQDSFQERIEDENDVVKDIFDTNK